MRVFLDLVAPHRCLACGAPGDAELCAGCAYHVVALDRTGCRRCGSPPLIPCGCEDLRGFDRARSLVAFSEPARSLTLGLKRRASGSTIRGVATLLAELAVAEVLYTGSELITFVPGGRSASRRGFDHAELLARATAHTLGAQMQRVLVRLREGPRQSDVSLAERRSNVADRFGSKPVCGPVLLLDDVFTTGSTAEACALALQRAGATRIDVLTWARTLRKRG